jgi:DNA helicase II / ATP-dependent DNA helicase PcrA
MIDFANELNERQAEAVACVDGPLLVLAGAGSGKTRVITYRIANLVANHGVAPRRIMAVTFTNKAAGEMRERVERLLGSGADVWVATFHASCARLLRRYGEAFGVDPRFTIYDDQDQKAMIARVLKELELSDRQFPPRAMQNEINRAKRELVGPDAYPQGDFYRARVQKVYALYETRMRGASALDFGDLLYRVVVGMRTDARLAAEISGLFDHVLVDEFQDTNRAQLELVRLLTPHRNVCVVGDDDQSIYSWRGADVTNILDFEKSFPGARAVTLDRNYRSTGNVLKAAHGVVSRLKGRRPKELWTSNPEGEKIGIVEAPDEREEARLVAKALRELVADGFPLREQAVFYRTNAQSRVFEEVFRALNIPHRVVGGMRFYERAEVKDVIAYMRLAQNPADHAAFVRVVNTPTRGIGKTTVDRIVALAAGRGVSAFEAISLPEAAGELGGAALGKLAAFRDMIEAWRRDAGDGPARLSKRIVAETEYVARLEAENNAEADARLENVRELLGSIEDFEADAEEATLASFLELIALQTDVDEARFDGEEATLMTVHAAKGLEFDVVFVTGLEEGLFPFRRSDGGIELVDGDERAAMDEERRLGYVAMTRARKRLFLTRAVSRKLFGGSRENPPSRFFAELPPGIAIDLTPGRPKVSLYGAPSAAPAAPPRARPAPAAQRDVWIDRSFDQSAPCALAPGMTVRHPRFGVGKVLAVSPGAKPKAEVQFPGFGRKTILAEYLELG